MTSDPNPPGPYKEIHLFTGCLKKKKKKDQDVLEHHTQIGHTHIPESHD